MTDDFREMLEIAYAEAVRTTTEVVAAHGIGELAGWSLDERKARLLFGDTNSRYALMAAQAIGMYGGGRWMWAWADPSFPAHLTQAAQHVRQWGHANDLALLTAPKSDIDDALAWRLAAFTARFVGYPGIYRGESAIGTLFLAFAATTQPEGPDPITPKALQTS